MTKQTLVHQQLALSDLTGMPTDAKKTTATQKALATKYHCQQHLTASILALSGSELITFCNKLT